MIDGERVAVEVFAVTEEKRAVVEVFAVIEGEWVAAAMEKAAAV